MGNEIKKPIYKKWWFWIIIFLVISLVTIEIYMYLLHINVIKRELKCDEPQNLVCFDESGTKIIKDNIPCSSDEDCKYGPVQEYCSPGGGSFTDCIGEQVYCGTDSFCKQCMCNY